MVRLASTGTETMGTDTTAGQTAKIQSVDVAYEKACAFPPKGPILTLVPDDKLGPATDQLVNLRGEKASGSEWGSQRAMGYHWTGPSKLERGLHAYYDFRFRLELARDAVR